MVGPPEGLKNIKYTRITRLFLWQILAQERRLQYIEMSDFYCLSVMGDFFCNKSHGVP